MACIVTSYPDRGEHTCLRGAALGMTSSSSGDFVACGLRASRLQGRDSNICISPGCMSDISDMHTTWLAQTEGSHRPEL